MCGPADAVEPSSKRAVPVVCVSSFEASAGDSALEGLSAAVSDLLQASLARNRDVAVVDRKRLADVMREQEVTASGLGVPRTVARLGGLLGADKFITGSVILVNRELTIVAHVLDVSTSVVQASRKVGGRPADLADLSVDLARQLATVLNIEGPSAEDYEEHPMGSLHFLRGLGFFQSGNYDRALSGLMLCGDMTPDHPTFRHWMGLCYFRLREFGHARIAFIAFIRDHPTSDKASEAKQLLNECEDKLQGAPPMLLLLSGGRQP